MINTKYPITFILKTLPGRKVSILADFSYGKPCEMTDRNGDGTYVCRAMLSPGEYFYRYTVDGEDFPVQYNKDRSISQSGHVYYIRKVFDLDAKTRGDRKKIVDSTMRSVLKECRKSTRLGKTLANNGLVQIQETIKSINSDLESFLSSEGASDSKQVRETRTKIKNEFRSIQDRFSSLPQMIGEELDTLNRRSADFTIVLFGRTMARKSTLMEILTNGDGSSIGKGAQRTTRDIRPYFWNGMEIIDVPGVCAADGEDDEGVALATVKKADLVLFLITDDSP